MTPPALALIASALLLVGCNYFEPRGVLWSWAGGTWVPLNEYRNLEECYRALGGMIGLPDSHRWIGLLDTHRCMPVGQVPTERPYFLRFGDEPPVPS
jgi:hypothetical protein